MDFKLGVIGFGNMGSAIVKGAINSGVISQNNISIYDSYKKVEENARAEGFKVYCEEREVIENSDAVLIAVKPVHAQEVFEKIGKYLEDKLIISIVAGLEVKNIRDLIAANIDDSEDFKLPRILRIMPNTPAIVGEGVFALDEGSDATSDERNKTEEIFKSLGLVEWVNESLFPVITALSGGGPAYVAMFIEALADAGVLHGLKRDAAIEIAAQTVLGSAAQIFKTGIHPALLKDMVCSPSGTTIEGVKSLEESSFRAGIIKAVDAATVKAEKMC